MTYFANFPYTTFEFSGNQAVVKDILRRARFLSEYRPYSDLFETYEINDSETPQTIAYDYYSSASYHWVIMIFNEIHDLTEEWPRNNYELDTYCEKKYGADKNSIMAWVDPNGNICGEVKKYSKGVAWIAPSNPGAPGNIYYTPLTFTNHEENENEKKRLIKIMRPELLSEFLKQFNDKINV
jgi:hypothetical protein